MKRIIAIFLLFCFLLVNSGMAISMHWCGGKITHISFFTQDEKVCSCGNKENKMKPGCCKDKTATLKSKNDETILHQIVFKIPSSKIIVNYLNYPPIQIAIVYTNGFPSFYHPPPYKPKVALHLLNSIFII